MGCGRDVYFLGDELVVALELRAQGVAHDPSDHDGLVARFQQSL
jgi:hypothetical protein